MGKLIVFFIGVIVLAIIVSVVVVYFRNKKGRETAKEKGWAAKGDLNLVQEQDILMLNDHASEIFKMLVAPPRSLYEIDMGERTFLSSEHKKYVELWLDNHKSVLANIKRKVIGR